MTNPFTKQFVSSLPLSFKTILAFQSRKALISKTQEIRLNNKTEELRLKN
jgi:hypothetical protein